MTELTHLTCFLECPCYNCREAKHTVFYDSKSHKVIECWKCNTAEGFRWADHECSDRHRPCEPDLKKIS